MPPIDAHEIFSWNHMYFLTGSHFAWNLKMAVLSLSLNLGAQSGATHSQRIAYLIYIEKKVISVIKKVCIFQDQPWNPPDFMDEIRRISSWNLPDFICKWGNLHMKSAGFHEIHQISWNSPDFTMKSGGFHEICRISPWNPPDFMNSGFCCIFLQNQYRYTWKD